MPRLILYFPREENRKPIVVENGPIPPSGFIYDIDEESYVVHFARQKLWSKRQYDDEAKDTEYIADAKVEVCLVTTDAAMMLKLLG